MSETLSFCIKNARTLEYLLIISRFCSLARQPKKQTRSAICTHPEEMNCIEEAAIQLATHAVEIVPAGHSILAAWQSKLGNKFYRRYEQTSKIQDLNNSIQLCRRAVEITPADHSDLAHLLNDLGDKLELRYGRTGKREDLEEAIQLSHRAVEVTPPNHPDLTQRLYNLGIKYAWRYDRTRTKDLEKALKGISFFADLNDFVDLLNDPAIKKKIDSVLTVTGSSQDAFANTAARYVRWHWGQRGIDILNWLSQFLLAARNPELSLTHPLRVYGEDEDIQQACIELQARLNNQSNMPSSEHDVAIQVRHINGSWENYYSLVAAVASQLAWIVAAFKDPPDEGVSFSSAKIEGPHFQSDKDCSSFFRIKYEDSPELGPKKPGTCWHQLFTGFNVAVGFRLPDRPYGMRGVELPFSIMAIFAGCSYPIAYKGGFVLKGWQNALFPVRSDSNLGLSTQASALQWHLFRSERHRLYMPEAKNTAPKLFPIRTKMSAEEFCTVIEQTDRHFLGLYQDSIFNVGTNDSRADKIALIHASNRLKETRLRRRLKWTRVLDFSAGGGAAGLTFGVSTGAQVRTKQERQLRLNHPAFCYQIDKSQFHRIVRRPNEDSVDVASDMCCDAFDPSVDKAGIS